MEYHNIREGELINKVARDYFSAFDTTRRIGDIDFCVAPEPDQGAFPFETPSLLWAEAKQGTGADIYESFVQLILTIGKARTFDKELPPPFLGAFDAEKIAFLPYSSVQEIFYQNDFNWRVAPSDHQTKEFQQIYQTVKATLEQQSLLFFFARDRDELNRFIRENFSEGKARLSKVRIDKNNFIVIYNKWLERVKPSIAVNWEIAKRNGIIDGDFYLADLLSRDNETLREKLYVVLNKDHYELDRKLNDMGMFSSQRTSFTDQQKAHATFWNKYERPPKEEYWEYIVNRRDLLVPQDVRERKGSFFTPRIWVELSQQYLKSTLGEDWQDEYYIWDCAAGTGNLLAGLTNKYNVWASTLDQQDVDVMKDRIANGAALLESHVFRFDFLNDDFSKLPEGLQNIINDPEKRKKLVIYINPPYAEAGDTKQRSGSGKNKTHVSNQTRIHQKYFEVIKNFAKRELYVQFLARIYGEIPGAQIAHFSTLKAIQAPYFSGFRDYFLAELKAMFVVPANSFDNVSGQFPIGFFVWNTNKKVRFEQVEADVYDGSGDFQGKKTFYSYDGYKNINHWLRPTWARLTSEQLAYLTCNSNDFQNSRSIFLQTHKHNQTSTYYKPVTKNNLVQSCIYLSVRKCIPANWLNDRDQFLHPDPGWQADALFQSNCLTYALFSDANNVQSAYGTNHWIPFRESEIDAKEKFDSNFMTDFIAGKIELDADTGLFERNGATKPLSFSAEAQAVFEAGRALWRYYHAQPDSNVNASYYDIRAYFQGRDENGRMKSRSEDENYLALLAALRERFSALTETIVPKVYDHGFLKS